MNGKVCTLAEGRAGPGRARRRRCRDPRHRFLVAIQGTSLLNPPVDIFQDKIKLGVKHFSAQNKWNTVESRIENFMPNSILKNCSHLLTLPIFEVSRRTSEIGKVSK